MRQANIQSPRRPMAYLSILGTTQLHLRSPVIIALWSAIFPGLGHLLLSKYIRGFLLFIWEIFVNYKANINLLILYSFVGDFEKAKSVVDIQWMTLYIPTYLFAIWNSYRAAVDLNLNYLLAAREDAKVEAMVMGSLEINYLDKRKPWVSAIWSALVPGAGQLNIHSIISAFFLVAWWIVVVSNSKLLPALHYTLLGDFQQAKTVIDMQWFLNIPSIYLFAQYDAYINTIENNKLFEWEQSKFFNKEYQDQAFCIPLNKEEQGDHMHVISTFEHTKHLELAITAIQMKGIKKEKILAIPLDKRSEDRKLFDSIHSADGISMLDLSFVLAAFFGIFGSIYGFVLAWGPLFWGLAAIISGFLLGILIKLFTTKKSKNGQCKRTCNEVVLIIECSDYQIEMVRDTLWAHYALGVRKLDLGSNS